MQCYDENNLEKLYDRVAKEDRDLEKIIEELGYPPLWVRPNTFETLVLTILEQQVSLASAYAAYKKLKENQINRLVVRRRKRQGDHFLPYK